MIDLRREIITALSIPRHPVLPDVIVDAMVGTARAL